MLDTEYARRKLQEEKRQQYTEDKDEWPPNKHQEVHPPENKPKPKEKPEVIEEEKPIPPCQEDKYHWWE